LQKSELACQDLLEENDELRVTISEIEKRLDSTLDEKDDLSVVHTSLLLAYGLIGFLFHVII